MTFGKSADGKSAANMCARAMLAAAVLALAVPARAQNPADFYKGRNVELYVGYSVGGGYDLYARVLARHIGRHIPGNPTWWSRTWRAPAACGSPTGSIVWRQRTARPSASLAAAPASIP